MISLIEFNSLVDSEVFHSSLPVCPLLPAENDFGSVEYKWKLKPPTASRLSELTTQLNFRLTEGRAACEYWIGVTDSGRTSGIAMADVRVAIEHLAAMAEVMKAEIIEIQLFKGQTGELNHTRLAAESDSAAGLFVCHVRLKRQSTTGHASKPREYSLALLGGRDASKSSLIGVLRNAELDNGKGKSRLKVFKHRHEWENGSTSAIVQLAIAFDRNGDSREFPAADISSGSDRDFLNFQAAPSESETKSDWENIDKIINFWDFPGDENYSRMNLAGIAANPMSFGLLCISAVELTERFGSTNKSISPISEEYYRLFSALEIPISIAITKIDLISMESRAELFQFVEQIFKSDKFQRIPIIFTAERHSSSSFSSFSSNPSILPIFPISCVSGEGIEILKKYLFHFPSNQSNSGANNEIQQNQTNSFSALETDRIEFCIEEIIKLEEIDNPIVGGIVRNGILRSGSKALLGPIEFNNETQPDSESSDPSPASSIPFPFPSPFDRINPNEFQSVTISRLHWHRQEIAVSHAGDRISIEIEGIQKSQLRRGQVILSIPSEPLGLDFPSTAREFSAEVQFYPLDSSIASQFPSLRVNSELIIYLAAIRQSARILEFQRINEDDELPFNSIRYRILFRFAHFNEYFPKNANNSIDSLHSSTRFCGFLCRSARHFGVGRIIEIEIPKLNRNQSNEEDNQMKFETKL